MITQLLNPIPLNTPKGPAMAHLVIDYGIDHDLQWVTFLKDGTCWTFMNADVRLVDNETMGRVSPSAASVESPLETLTSSDEFQYVHKRYGTIIGLINECPECGQGVVGHAPTCPTTNSKIPVDPKSNP